jgi:hypothetical protein
MIVPGKVMSVVQPRPVRGKSRIRSRAAGTQVVPGLLALLAILVLGAIGRPTPGRPATVAAGAQGTAVETAAGQPVPDAPGGKLAAAAAALEAMTAEGGEGYSFAVVQRNRLYAKPGAKQIAVTDPQVRFMVAVGTCVRLGSPSQGPTLQ